MLSLCCYFCSSCQSITIKGNVINDEGAAVPGASITIKGTNKSTIADAKGIFTIPDSHPGDTLIVSAVGYEITEEPNNVRGELTIVLKRKAKTLSEVVLNTGYQFLSPERTTGSYEQIKQQDLLQRSETSILGRLNGSVASISFPDKLDGPLLMVRGLSTISGPKSPLIVLDNFPYEGNIANIDPDDIESITVLKDAAASSIWGTKAGNGVIVITTKKGKFNTPLKIQYNTSLTITTKPDLFYLPVMSSSSFIDVEQFLFSKGYYNAEISSNSKPALSPVVELLIKKANGQLPAAEADARINAYRNVDIRNEYDKYIYRDALNTQHTINISGGGVNMAYILAFAYNKNISNTSSLYDRYNLRAENSYKPFKNLQIDLGFVFTQTVSAPSGKPEYNNIKIGARQIPYLRFADQNGNPLPVATVYRETYTDTAGAGRLLNWKYYPLDDYKHRGGTTDLDELILNLSFHYNFSRSLKLDVIYQRQKQQTHLKNVNDLQSYSTRNSINTFSQINNSTGVVKYNIPLGGILNTNDNTIKSQNARAQLNYNHNWSYHTLSVIAGAETRQVNTDSYSSTVYGYNDDFLTNGKVDYVNSYPSYVTGSSIFIPDGTSFTGLLNRFVSCYGNLAYTFKDRYTFSASARKDASNLFGLNTNEKWNPLWSSGFAWILSNEKFYALSFLPYFRCRITYGFSGNVDPGKSAVTTVRYLNTAQYTNFQTVGVNQFANPDLRWEKVGQVNIGVDFRTLHDVFTGSLEYYNKKAIDLFGPSFIDYTVGIGNLSVTRNIASMKATGIELTLDSKIIDQNLKWNNRFILNYNTDKTLSYQSASTTLARNYVTNGNSISPLVGRPLYSVVSYQWAGLDSTGAPRGILNKNPSTDYNNIIGSGNPLSALVYKNALPKFYGSLVNNFSWRNFSLTANIVYKLGYYFRRTSFSYGGLYANGNAHADFEKRWQKPGDELITSVPAMVYPVVTNRDAFYLSSETLVEKGDHIRLQFVSLSYDLKKIDIKKFRPLNINLFITASDLGIIWKANKQGIDPGYRDNIPASRSFTLGCKLDL